MSDVPALDFRLPTSGPDAEVIPLARALKRRLPELSWNRLRDLCLAGKVKVDGERVLDGRRQVNPGQHIELDPSAAAPNAAPPPKGALRIMYEDSQIVVIDKPAGVATVPFEDQERVTVLDLVRKLWRETGSTDPKTSMFVVQRLDKDTSGVMVLAKTDQARALLEAQFRKHTLEREYLAVVNGIIERDNFVMDTFIAADRGDGLRGSVASAALGKHAITEVKVVELLAEATLVRCRLETGRTHQVRIHLSERGHPLVGEKVYVRGYEGPQHEAGRQALHAVKLSFRHPLNGRTMQFGSPLPPDLQHIIRTLGGTYVAPEPVTQEKKDARQSWEHEVRDWWKEGPQPAARPARPAKGDKRVSDERRERPARSFDGGDRRERPASDVDGGDRRERPARDVEGGDRRERPARSFDGGDRRERPARSFDGGDSRERPARGFDGGDRRERPARSFDGGDRRERPARSFDGGDRRERPARDFEGGDRRERPARSFDGGDRRERPARSFDGGDRRERPARSFDGGDRRERPARGFDGGERRERPARDFDGGDRRERPARSFDGGDRRERPADTRMPRAARPEVVYERGPLLEDEPASAPVRTPAQVEEGVSPTSPRRRPTPIVRPAMSSAPAARDPRSGWEESDAQATGPRRLVRPPTVDPRQLRREHLKKLDALEAEMGELVARTLGRRPTGDEET